MTTSTRAILTVQEVADLTGFSPRTIYKWARTGAIPSKKFGTRSRRFDRREIETWIAKRRAA
jgi:excisionase family DNA binding protein